MVFKSITTRKTRSGYSITVFVKDGELVKPLVAGLQRFFVIADQQKNGQGMLVIAPWRPKDAS